MSYQPSFFETPSLYLIQLIFKSLSAFLIGAIAALIFHTFFGYSTFGFVFIGVVFSGLVLKFIGKSSLLKVFLFDVAFLFLLILLKAYITLAPEF